MTIIPKNIFRIFLSIAIIAMPSFAHAQLKFDDAITQSTTAHSSIVINQITGEVLYSKHASDVWVPASLTKLLTTLTILDLKPNFAQLCDINSGHDVGGAKLFIAGPAKYSLRDLMSASLVGSANNATNALADCTGLSREQFVATMNEKAKSLGAAHSLFVDPAGISEFNKTTAEDMAHIANAAFSTKTVRDFSQQKSVSFCAKAGAKKCHTITNTNQLLTDKTVTILAGKTGYLDESLYNFAGSFKNKQGQYVVALVLGAPNKKASFEDTKKIAAIGWSKIAQNQFKKVTSSRFQPGKTPASLPLAFR